MPASAGEYISRDDIEGKALIRIFPLESLETIKIIDLANFNFDWGWLYHRWKKDINKERKRHHESLKEAYERAP